LICPGQGENPDSFRPGAVQRPGACTPGRTTGEHIIQQEDVFTGNPCFLRPEGGPQVADALFGREPDLGAGLLHPAEGLPIVRKPQPVGQRAAEKVYLIISPLLQALGTQRDRDGHMAPRIGSQELTRFSYDEVRGCAAQGTVRGVFKADYEVAKRRPVFGVRRGPLENGFVFGALRTVLAGKMAPTGCTKRAFKQEGPAPAVAAPAAACQAASGALWWCD
jgi:hypothetical protein